MTVEDIIKEKIRASGADGLCLMEHDGCGCDLEDLMPCGGESILECQLARKVRCTDECDHDGEKLDCHYEPLRRSPCVPCEGSDE